MAQILPILQGDILIYQQDGHTFQVAMGTPAWYAWVKTASHFTFRSAYGTFTAHKERAGNKRGGEYWRAYYKRDGKLCRVYLGKSEKLTLQQLNTVAARLSRAHESDEVHNMQELGAGVADLHTDSFATSTHPRQDRKASRSHSQQAEASLSSNTDNSANTRSFLSHLPVPLSAFIGRERERATVCALLCRPEIRIVTLTGTGGVGKTRLALSIAEEIRDDFADGVCFVPLASTSAPEQVIPTIAQALGLWEVGDRPLLEQLQAYLHDQHVLLLLDNFEQVIEAASQLADVLTSCPYLTILVTSRAALHLSGEYEFTVPLLAVPDLSQLPASKDLSQVAAVAFFLHRAQSILPDFALTEANARSIAEICVRLDGLPLAIGLAAARIKLLPPQALLSRLSQRLDLLTGGARDLPARQQTLRNTLQWSYDLLSTEEQRLFRQLSVFVGGCTLEAASTAYQAGTTRSIDVLEGIASLLDKSLVQQMEQESEEPRFMMLETIREYGQECLREQGELGVMRHAHAAYYVALVEEANKHLFSAEAGTWLDLLEREYENIRAALLWTLEPEEEQAGSNIEIAALLGRILWRFWSVRGRFSEGRTLLEHILVASERSDAPIRANALFGAGALIYLQSDYARLEKLGKESLSLFHLLGDQKGIGCSMVALAGIAAEAHDYARARSQAEEALAIFKAIDASYFTGLALLILGRLASTLGEYFRAEQLFEESLALYRTFGYQGEIAWPLIYLARNAISQGDLTRARALLEEARSLFSEIGHKWGLAQALGFLGQVALEQGDVVNAKAYLTESLRLNREVGHRQRVARSLLLLAHSTALEGNLTEAHALYEQSLAIATLLEQKGLIASCLEGLAVVASAQGQSISTVRLWSAAEVMRPNGKASLPPLMREMAEKERTAVRTRLGEEAFAQALTEGRMMTSAQILSEQELTTMSTSMESKETPTPQTRRIPSNQAGLTAREVEVLRLVAQGITDAQVAEQLVISPRTVNWYLTSIYNKLDVSSRSAATRYALEHQLA